MRQCARCGQDCRGKKGLETHDKRCQAPKDGKVIAVMTTAPPISIMKCQSPDMEGYEGKPVPAEMNFRATGEVDVSAQEYIYTVWDISGPDQDTHPDGGIPTPQTALPELRMFGKVPMMLGRVRRPAKAGARFNPIEMREGWKTVGARSVKIWHLR